MEEILQNADVIVGATGSNPISLKVLQNIKHNCLLISVSSSDREFPSVEIRKQFPQNSNSHEDYKLENIKLINSGFPVNFTGERLSLPLEQVQLTDSLILSSIFQAKQSGDKNGFIELSEQFQEIILNKFMELEPTWKYLTENV